MIDNSNQNKNIQFNLIIVGLITIITLLGSFIFINISYRNRVLPNSDVNGISVSLQTEDQLKKTFDDQIKPTLSQNLEVKIDNFTYNIPSDNLAISLNTDEIVDFGKGSNLIETITESLSSIAGHSFPLSLNLNEKSLIDSHPYKFNTSNAAYIDSNNQLKNCEFREFKVEFDYEKLHQLLESSIINNERLESSIYELAKDKEEARLLYYCEYYNNDLNQIKKSLDFLSQYSNFNVQEQLGIFLTNGGLKWKVLDKAKLKAVLEQYKESTDVLPQRGDYEYIDNHFVILSRAQDGKFLDVENTTTNIEAWLSDLDADPQFDYKNVSTNSVLNTTASIDFTNLLARGETRIDIIRNGSYNSAVTISQAGIEELHNTIVYPGEEFSFIGHVKPRNNNVLIMESGRPLGGGTCNTTTTLFRAVLEAGLKITDRSPHTYYVDSYAWGKYPINIVEATYYYQPNVDFKFVNDTKYPILMRSIITRDNENYQYHIIEIYSDTRSIVRDVTLSNWEKHGIVNDKMFSASFLRTVRENGQIIIQDKFNARYGERPEY